MKVRAVWRLIKTAADAWVRNNTSRLGAALSYYTTFSIAPLVIILIFLASLLLKTAWVRKGLFDQVATILGKQGAAAIQSSLAACLIRKDSSRQCWLSRP